MVRHYHIILVHRHGQQLVRHHALELRWITVELKLVYHRKSISEWQTASQAPIIAIVMDNSVSQPLTISLYRHGQQPFRHHALTLRWITV